VLLISQQVDFKEEFGHVPMFPKDIPVLLHKKYGTRHNKIRTYMSAYQDPG
jgi:hypothetical protein